VKGSQINVRNSESALKSDVMDFKHHKLYVVLFRFTMTEIPDKFYSPVRYIMDFAAPVCPFWSKKCAAVRQCDSCLFGGIIIH